MADSFVLSFNNVKALGSAPQKWDPEKQLVSLSLGVGSLYQHNTPSNWQHCAGRQRVTLRHHRVNRAENATLTKVLFHTVERMPSTFHGFVPAFSPFCISIQHTFVAVAAEYLGSITKAM